MLLSLLRPNWSFKNRGMSLVTPMCEVHKRYPYKKSIGVTVYGLTRDFTAVLTGYGLEQDITKPRSNKGYLYGWNSRVKPSQNGKVSFLFYSDFVIPKPVKGQSAEFCSHIYSPPLKIGPTVRKALGSSVDDPNRNFNSDEKLDLVIRREGNPHSKKIASCCFLTHG
ncbi:hypothetical protein MACK_001084 [Theileria orientalis]|uniref:Uncharacterized protein n=1 Tax=Theileria orientalis TaxID=68886 RepID=A0A976MBT5_THEOR|nr:hypothetical protein MACK_001084 [Theileria orientalis]